MDRLSAEKSIAVFGFAGVIVGAILPWARIIPFSVPGTDGNGVIRFCQNSGLSRHGGKLTQKLGPG